MMLGYFNKEKLAHHCCQEMHVTPTVPEPTLNALLFSFGYYQWMVNALLSAGCDYNWTLSVMHKMESGILFDLVPTTLPYASVVV